MADGNFEFKVNGFDSYTLLLGEELRGERATLGKSLLQVQKDLKIKAAYISAIENCDLDAFPNKGFVAGYVRSYARYLNLNPEEVYERFCMESGFSSHDKTKNINTANMKKTKGLKDYNIETHLDWKPSYIGFQKADKSVFSRGYVYFGPILLAFLILFGVSFGAWKVLIDIQKLKIVPADSLPTIMSEMNIQSSEIIRENKINSYQLQSKNFRGIDKIVSDSTQLVAPQVYYRDGPIVNLHIEDIGVLGTNSVKLNRLPRSLERSMQKISTKRFDFGVVPEFGSSMSIKSNNDIKLKIGLVASKEDYLGSKSRIDFQNGHQQILRTNVKDNEVLNTVETKLNIFAVNPSWIRIKDEGRKVVVEKTLKAGEVLEIKNNWLNGNLRAGNAKDLFFSLDGVTYGPVSDKRKVIKNFKIDPQNIFNSLKINDLKDSYLNSSSNNDRSL